MKLLLTASADKWYPTYNQIFIRLTNATEYIESIRAKIEFSRQSDQKRLSLQITDAINRWNTIP